MDVTDGSAVQKHFSPNAWHEIDDLVVCRQRELRTDTICAREIVLKKSGGLVRDRTYGMRLYDSGALKILVEACGFSRTRTYTDFSPMEIRGGDLGFMNHRMLITAQKPRDRAGRLGTEQKT